MLERALPHRLRDEHLRCQRHVADVLYDERLEHHHDPGPGDFVYIPPFCPHETYNLSRRNDAVFVTARTDPFEQERVVVTPEIDDGQCEARVEYVD